MAPGTFCGTSAENDLNVQSVGDIGDAEIRGILRSGRPVPFFVAVIGAPLRWIRGDDRFAFWKNELQPRLVEPSAVRIDLDDFDALGEYYYLASDWRGCNEGGAFCVLCEERD